MYAVIQTGGKQYRVKEGDVLRLEKLAGDPGSTIEFDRVLLLGEGEQVELGSPFLEGRTVRGTVRSQGRARKIEIIKLRRRKHYRRTQGHRQAYTEVEITAIGAGGRKSAGRAATKAAGGEGSAAAGAGGGKKEPTAKSAKASAGAGTKEAKTDTGAASKTGATPRTGDASGGARRSGSGKSGDQES